MVVLGYRYTLKCLISSLGSALFILESRTVTFDLRKLPAVNLLICNIRFLLLPHYSTRTSTVLVSTPQIQQPSKPNHHHHQLITQYLLSTKI